MSRSTVIVGQRIFLNFDAKVPAMADIKERVEKITKGRLTFCGGTSFFDNTQFSDGFVGVAASSLYVYYEEAAFEEVSTERLEEARVQFEQVLKDIPALYIRLGKTFPGFEASQECGTYLVHETSQQSAAELFHGLTGKLFQNENFQWSIEIHGEHDYDLESLLDTLRDEQFRPISESHPDYDESFVDEDICNAKYKVVKALERIDAKVIRIYEDRDSFDLLIGEVEVCLLEGAVDRQLELDTIKKPGKLKEARLYHFLECY